ncbi:MAG TPA: histidine kinase [Acidimicrobiales bacterium]|nr:histidine kinase [Acidimicrobiales bacterium]
MSTPPESPLPERRYAYSPLNGAINLASLGLLIWGLVYEAHPSVTGPASHVAGLVLMVAASAGWLGWLSARHRKWNPTLHQASLGAMALFGGALATFAPLAVVYPGVAALAATASWPLKKAAPVVAAGPAAMLVASAAAGHRLSPVMLGVAAALAGTVMGTSRREAQERDARAMAFELAQGRAELLAARNHLARELHDVLAHTLSATSLQLEALDALMQSGPAPDPAVTEQLARLKRLVRDGLDEARGAVRALREDLPPLDERLSKLVAERDATLAVTGHPRDLPPEVALTLYRAAQEALTNVMKHAPGATADVQLDFSDKGVRLVVWNPSAPAGGSALAASGGGYGLQGIKERVLLVGGRVQAGPVDGGWRVEAEVPV